MHPARATGRAGGLRESLATPRHQQGAVRLALPAGLGRRDRGGPDPGCRGAGLGHEGDGRVEGRRVGKHCRTGCRTLSRPLGHRVRTLRGGRRRRDPRQQERERDVARTGPEGGNRLVRRAADGHRAETHLRGADDLLFCGGTGVKGRK